MIDAVLGILGTILYPLFAIFFVLIDLVQAIFKSFAGIGDASYRKSTFNYDNITSGQYKEDSKWGGILDDNNGGLVYYLLRSDLVMNLVWSIATLALILLIVFTVIAFIKNIYAPKSKSWQEIIGLSVKGLFNFIFIPVVCLLGIILGNILLNAIDGATSTGGATTMSRKLFLSAAYDANWIRMGNTVSYNQANRAIDLHNSVFKKGIAKVTVPQGKKGSDAIEGADVEYYANLVDEAYGTGGVFLTDHHNWISVEANYSLPRINYLTLAVGGVFMMYALGSISFGMVKRLFTLLVLFIISPAACAMYPLDEGNACKQITGEFKKNTISAYGAVAGMNLFMSIAPMIENINIAGSDAGGVITDIIGVNSILHLILLVCGLFMVKDFISMISNYFDAGNAYEQGAGLMSSVKKKIGDTTTKGVKVAGAFHKANTIRKTIGGKAGVWEGFKSIGGDAFGAATGLKVEDLKKIMTDSKVAGRKAVDERGKRLKVEANETEEKNAVNDAVEKRMKRGYEKGQITKKVNAAKKYNQGLIASGITNGPFAPEDREYYENERRRELRDQYTHERYDMRTLAKGADGLWDTEEAVKHLAMLKGDKQQEMLHRYVAGTNGGVSVDDLTKALEAFKDKTKSATGAGVDNTVNTVEALSGQVALETDTINNLAARISTELATDKYSAGSYTSAILQNMMTNRQTVSQDAIDRMIESGDSGGAKKLADFNRQIEELTRSEERKKSLMAEQEGAIKSYISELTTLSKNYKTMQPSLSVVIKSLGELAKGMSDGSKSLSDFQTAMKKAKDDVKDITKGKK